MTLPQQTLFSWLDERSAGILLHLTSLPSETGIGNLGDGAFRFVDFLSASGMKLWQLCPLGPTGFGDSPYQCFSAYAGNPYFIDLNPLLDAGLISSADFQKLGELSSDRVDYGALYETIWPILKSAFENFKSSGQSAFQDYGDLNDFRSCEGYWLEDYALFMALKEHFGGQCWLGWPLKFRDHTKAVKQSLPEDVSNEIEAQVFYQYLFYAQLKKLRHYAASKAVQIMGDVPIFVALDSADVWANPKLFQLKKDFSPKAVAGVPPDYFAATGQLWGNPLYAWNNHQADGFAWWLQRVRSTLDFYDIVRLDHFRGFESFWSIPAEDETAENGKWLKAPGLELFQEIAKAFPHAKLVAEDLGEITDDVRSLREQTGLPGMAVLHFAFDGSASNGFLPHNYKRNCVAYSGTHDNDTSIGWYQSTDDSTRDQVRRYLEVDGTEISWDLFRATVKSSAYIAVTPLQDLLGLGTAARLNQPGTSMGNWQWRFRPEQLDKLQRDASPYLRQLLELYGR